VPDRERLLQIGIVRDAGFTARDEADDARLELDEDTELGDTADVALRHLPNRIGAFRR
jgi:hypothetical protein